jgi:hypothetical protein
MPLADRLQVRMFGSSEKSSTHRGTEMSLKRRIERMERELKPGELRRLDRLPVSWSPGWWAERQTQRNVSPRAFHERSGDRAAVSALVNASHTIEKAASFRGAEILPKKMKNSIAAVSNVVSVSLLSRCSKRDWLVTQNTRQLRRRSFPRCNRTTKVGLDI